MKWVYASVVAYTLGVALFWPRVFMVVDEDRYVTQAIAFSHGSATIHGAGVVYPASSVRTVSNYPPGTSLLQTPLVWAFGWRGAAALSVIALCLATLLVARWLAADGKNPAFALVIPGYAGAALFGRVAMSDLPATAFVAAVCYLLYARPQGRAGAARSGLCVFCAGALLLFREPPVLIIAPLIGGAILRRQLDLPGVIAGAAAALGLRFGTAELLFGTPFYVRDPGPGFALASLAHSVPIYGLLLLVMIPGGAILPFVYRGRHRHEMLAAFCFYVAIFLLFGSNSVEESGALKGILHASRYMVPLLPVLAYQAATVWPRAYAALIDRWSVIHYLPGAACAAAIGVAFLVHPAMHEQEVVPLSIVRALMDHTHDGEPLITNTNASLKYLGIAYGRRLIIARYDLAADSIPTFASRYAGLGAAFVDRNDSEDYRRDADGNDRFLASLRDRCIIRSTYAASVASWARVRTFEIDSCHL
jgi:hypothetical protein